MSALTHDRLQLKRIVWVVQVYFYDKYFDRYTLSEVDVVGVFSKFDDSEKFIEELRAKYIAEGMHEDEFGFARAKMAVE